MTRVKQQGLRSTGLKVFVDCVPSMRELSELAKDVFGPRAVARRLHHPAGVVVLSDSDWPNPTRLAVRVGDAEVAKVLMQAMLEGLAASGKVSPAKGQRKRAEQGHG